MHLDLLRSFFVVAEQGSLNRAAEHLRVSQSTLTRQMRALEHEMGGKLLERSPAGVALTATGQVLLDGIRPVVARFDAVVTETRKLARGQSATLRLGYMMSAAPDFLNPALAALRRSHPHVKVKLLDLSPGEQIGALRRGAIDFALLGNAGASLTREFYVRKIATRPVVVAVAEHHPLATRAKLTLKDLQPEHFVGAAEADMPGHNRWVAQLCRKAGYRPRFLEDSESLTHGLATVVTEGAITLLPDYVMKMNAPGVAFRPLAEPNVTWELLVAWQRGKATEAVKAMLAAFPAKG